MHFKPDACGPVCAWFLWFMRRCLSVSASEGINNQWRDMDHV